MMTEVEPGRSLAWRTVATWRFPDSTAWRITLEPAAAGTRIVQSYDVVQCPRWWEWLVTRLVQAHQDRSAALTADLVRLGAVSGAAALPG